MPGPVEALHEHPVRFATGSRCHELFGAEASVNSYHHQGVADPGRLVPTGWCPDDELIEAVEHPDHPFAVGVQWHPEDMARTLIPALLIVAALVRPPAQSSRDSPPSSLVTFRRFKGKVTRGNRWPCPVISALAQKVLLRRHRTVPLWTSHVNAPTPAQRRTTEGRLSIEPAAALPASSYRRPAAVAARRANGRCRWGLGLTRRQRVHRASVYHGLSAPDLGMNAVRR